MSSSAGREPSSAVDHVNPQLVEDTTAAAQVVAAVLVVSRSALDHTRQQHPAGGRTPFTWSRDVAQPSYIPTKQSMLATWAGNFSTLITANPTLYGLLPADAVTIAGYVNTFLSNYALSATTSPATRTATTISQTATSSTAMLGIIRPYAIQIRNNAGVTNSDKLALGLNLPSSGRTPILVPSTNPLLAVVAATPGVFTMKFQDPNSSKRSKPFGARAVQVCYVIGTTPVIGDPPAGYTPIMVTKQPFALSFDSSANGKVATIWCRWYGRDTGTMSPTGAGFGPWSAPVSQTVTF